MSLGKRGRPPMKRNLSMTEFTLDLINGGEDDRVFPQLSPNFSGAFSAAASHRRSSSDFVETANFLRDCSLCKRRLISGQDIYMYRGDTAFCSTECRQHQMTKDEWREKKCSISKKEVATAAVNHLSSGGESVAAAV
ncbi:FCS-Like Zinc finger 5-like isoform X2 [Salvia splendens]|uniref:FCS-Like Zinc finger 5-like isoform X2 n=1 Tax=Salvia splendens TaxID=180675 RepID=UPI001C28029B|nr:FCS-Like Zinc finger 5-like isoform X2 [Salvia splendens]